MFIVGSNLIDIVQLLQYKIVVSEIFYMTQAELLKHIGINILHVFNQTKLCVHILTLLY